MLNRWQGNTGRRVLIEEANDRHEIPAADAHREAPQPQSAPRHSPAPLPFLQTKPFSELLPQTLGSLETEDIILLLILYLLYRESGDSELLMIMGGMFLL